MFDWHARGVDSPCITRWLPFYSNDNMDNMDNMHQPVAELEQIWDANLPSLHFPLLFQHGELGWHLAVRYQGGTTSHNNNRISCR